MNVKVKCIIAETVCEGLLGSAAGIIMKKTILPKCSTSEAVVVTLGSMVAMWKFGNDFGRKFYKYCDDVLCTDFMEPKKHISEEEL